MPEIDIRKLLWIPRWRDQREKILPFILGWLALWAIAISLYLLLKR